jgi:hypothetical protein
MAKAFSLSCVHCDLGMGIKSRREAESLGWTDIHDDDGPSWNQLGYCSSCRLAEELRSAANSLTFLEDELRFLIDVPKQTRKAIDSTLKTITEMSGKAHDIGVTLWKKRVPCNKNGVIKRRSNKNIRVKREEAIDAGTL